MKLIILSLALIAVITSLFIIRLLSSIKLSPSVSRAAGPPTRLLLVLGSGGHTAELLSSLQSLPSSRYTHRTYLISSGDSFSIERAKSFELQLSGLAELRRKPYGSFDIAIVPRARKVHQSIFTTPWSCLNCFFACIRVLATAPSNYKRQWMTFATQRTNLNTAVGQKVAEREVVRLGVTPFPDLIISNGPATGLIVILAAVALRFVGLGKARASDGKGGMRTLFIESWARVKSLSLTGRILVATGICQRVLVQWEGLKGVAGKGVHYIGPVVR